MFTFFHNSTPSLEGELKGVRCYIAFPSLRRNSAGRTEGVYSLRIICMFKISGWSKPQPYEAPPVTSCPQGIANLFCEAI